MTAKEMLVVAGLDKSYWGRIIIRAEERGYFTAREKGLAGSWLTCACGKQNPRIPRYVDGRPKDDLLMHSGASFFASVRANAFVNAAETLIEIEKRSTEILAKTYPAYPTAATLGGPVK